MKKLIALFLALASILSMAACSWLDWEPEQPDPNAGLNQEIYVDKDWDILEAKHEK